MSCRVHERGSVIAIGELLVLTIPDSRVAAKKESRYSESDCRDVRPQCSKRFALFWNGPQLADSFPRQADGL